MREKQQKIKELVERLEMWHDQGLSESQIKKQEESLGVSFPEQYKEFLRMYGWILIGEGFLGTNLGIKETHNLRENFPQTFPKNLIPIDDYGNGDYTCLVCGGKDHGKVILWRHDVPEYFVYPNIPDEDWFRNHPDWAKNHINGKKEDFWVEAPDFWTWLLNRLELERQMEEDET